MYAHQCDTEGPVVLGMETKIFLFVYKYMHIYSNTACMHLTSKLLRLPLFNSRHILQVRIILICIDLWKPLLVYVHTNNKKYCVDRKHKLHYCFYLLTGRYTEKTAPKYRNVPKIQVVKAIVCGCDS